jgi:hypothetical protein
LGDTTKLSISKGFSNIFHFGIPPLCETSIYQSGDDMLPDLRPAQHHCPAAGGKHRAPVKTVGLRGVQHLGGYARRAANGWKRLQKPTKSRHSIRKI